MYKRFFSFFSALVFCAGIILGSLSFIPKSKAWSPVNVNFLPSDLPGFQCAFTIDSSSTSTFFKANSLVICTSSDAPSSHNWLRNTGSSVYFDFPSNCHFVLYFYYDATSRLVDLNSPSSSNTYSTTSSGGWIVFSSSTFPKFDGFSLLEFVTPQPISDIPIYWDFQPFYFPELPYGYFDGHINSLDGSFTLDLGQVQGVTSSSGTSSGSGNTSGGDLYAYTSGSGYLISGSSRVPAQDITYELEFDTSSHLSTSGTWSASDVEGDIQYIPSFNETSRFRTWAVVSGSSYCYFVCDTRNTITGSLESVNGDKGKLRFSAVGSDGVHYPFYCIEFYFDGTKIQTLSALPNGFTVDFKGGTLEQDQDTSVWSCVPLYHGFWLSDGCPPVVLSSLSNDSFKWLANPVFGEDAFTLNFLNAINESINNLNQSVTSSISNQTSAFQNMDAPSNFDPTYVNNMLEYGSLESDFQAPSTDDIFTVDSGTFTDGMGFWRDRMNELLFFSGSPALPMTIFSLTLGLAVLIIGRRVSGGGVA